MVVVNSDEQESCCLGEFDNGTVWYTEYWLDEEDEVDEQDEWEEDDEEDSSLMLDSDDWNSLVSSIAFGKHFATVGVLFCNGLTSLYWFSLVILCGLE